MPVDPPVPSPRAGSRTSLEVSVYGSRWNTIHGGYFADPGIAQPLVAAILDAACRRRPSMIADLGGGTGFLLAELLKTRSRQSGAQSASLADGVRLVNVDVAGRQTAQCRHSEVETTTARLEESIRRRLEPGDGPLMFVMRSVLHYFGSEGIEAILRHLRLEMLPGETFVHQTACFRHADDAACLNDLYRRMGTEKWYPTVAELTATLEKTGWQVQVVLPAASLPLDSGSLAERYHLEPADLCRIAGAVLEGHGQRPGVFVPTSEGFCAWLHYAIFVCQASE